MKKSLIAGALLAVFATMTGCATMFSGKDQEVSFNSKPQGAEVLVGTKTCTTPCKMQIPKNKIYREIVVSKNGYQKEKINVVASLDPFVYLNLLNMGFGSIVDYVAGSYAKYDPEYLIQLDKK